MRPKAYCINLDRFPSNYSNIVSELSDYLDIERVSAIDANVMNITGQLAIRKTTIALFNKIIEESVSGTLYAIILEDDIYRLDNFDQYWNKIVEFIENKNNNWDFISLDNILKFDNTTISNYNDFFYKIDKSRACGFMIYNISFLRKNINYLMNCGVLDTTMKYNPDFIQLIPKELIIRQYVDKYSTTANQITSFQNEFYNDTIRILTERNSIEDIIHIILTEPNSIQDIVHILTEPMCIEDTIPMLTEPNFIEDIIRILSEPNSIEDIVRMLRERKTI